MQKNKLRYLPLGRHMNSPLFATNTGHFVFRSRIRRRHKVRRLAAATAALYVNMHLTAQTQQDFTAPKYDADQNVMCIQHVVKHNLVLDGMLIC